MDEKIEKKEEQKEDKKTKLNVLKTIITHSPAVEEVELKETNVNAKILYGLTEKLKSFKLLDTTKHNKINKTNKTNSNITCTTLESCISVQRIIATIKLYKQSNNNIDTINDCTDTINNLVVTNLLSDYDHLVNYHLKNKTLSFLKYAFNSINTIITNNIGSCDISNCKCSINGNIVDVLHSYLVHPTEAVAGYKKNTKKVIPHIPSLDEIPHYQFGHKFYYWKYYKYNNEQEIGPNKGYKKKYWYITKKYDNFKHEVLNKDHINIKLFEHVTEKVTAYLPSDYVKALKSDTSYAEHYEIKPGTAITSEHLMSVLLWTDCSMLASTFSATFRYINSEETDKELKERNREFWHWSKALSETVHLYGTPICQGSSKYFFYGISQPLLFSEFVAYFCGPASCSAQISSAMNFAGNNGILLELKRTNGFSNLKCFDCAPLSDFPEEKERLFFGCDKPLRFSSITTIEDRSSDKQLMPVLALLHGVINGTTPSSQKQMNKRDIKALSAVLTIVDPAVPVDSTLSAYYINCFKMFCDNKETINIHIELMRTYYKPFSEFFIDKQIDNLLNLELITITFPTASVINVYKVGNVFDLYIDSLVMKCQRLNEMNANHLKEINFHDITYKQKSLDQSFMSTFSDRFIYEAYCTISVETKMQKITNDDGTVTQIPEYSILKILRDT